MNKKLRTNPGGYLRTLTENVMLNQCVDLTKQMAAIRRDIDKSSVARARVVQAGGFSDASTTVSVSSSPPRLNHTPLVIPTASESESPDTLFPKEPMFMLPSNGGVHKIPVTKEMNPRTPFNRRLISSTPDPEKALEMAVFVNGTTNNIPANCHVIENAEKMKESGFIRNYATTGDMPNKCIGIHSTQNVDANSKGLVNKSAKHEKENHSALPNKFPTSKRKDNFNNNKLERLIGQSTEKVKSVTGNKNSGRPKVNLKPTSNVKRNRPCHKNAAKIGASYVKKNVNNAKEINDRKKELEKIKKERLKLLLLQSIGMNSQGGLSPNKDSLLRTKKVGMHNEVLCTSEKFYSDSEMEFVQKENSNLVVRATMGNSYSINSEIVKNNMITNDERLRLNREGTYSVHSNDTVNSFGRDNTCRLDEKRDEIRDDVIVVDNLDNCHTSYLKYIPQENNPLTEVKCAGNIFEDNTGLMHGRNKFDQNDHDIIKTPTENLNYLSKDNVYVINAISQHNSEPNRTYSCSENRNNNSLTDERPKSRTVTPTVKYSTEYPPSYNKQCATNFINRSCQYETPNTSKTSDISNHQMQPMRLQENFNEPMKPQMPVKLQKVEPMKLQSECLRDSGIGQDYNRLTNQKAESMKHLIARIQSLSKDQEIQALLDELSRVMGDISFNHDIPDTPQKHPPQADFLDKMVLMSQFSEERAIVNQLKETQRDLHIQLDLLKADRHQLLLTITEKDSEKAQCRQDQLQMSLVLNNNLEELRHELDMTTQHQRRLEQENHILSVSLTERDREISHLHEFTQEVKNNIFDIIREMETESNTALNSTTHSTYLSSLRKLLKGDYPKNSKYINTDDILSISKQDYGTTDTTSSPLTVHNIAHHNSNMPLLTHLVEYKTNPTKITEQSGGFCNYRSSWKHNDNEWKIGSIPWKQNIGESQIGSLPWKHNGDEMKTGSLPWKSNVDVLKSGSIPWKPNVDIYKIGAQIPTLIPTDHDENSFDEKMKNLTSQSDTTISENTIIEGDVQNSPGKQVKFDCPNGNDFKNLIGNDGVVSETASVSRYSVTDYFRKYPQNGHDGGLVVNGGSKSSGNDNMCSDSDQNYLKSTVDIQSENVAAIKLNCDELQSGGKSKNGDKIHSNSTDNTTKNQINISDNFSTNSGFTISSISTLTSVDDENFRQDLARLDENILRIKHSLEMSKDSFKSST